MSFTDIPLCLSLNSNYGCFQLAASGRAGYSENGLRNFYKRE
ncbi:hypothetical protein CIT292_09383 [Citrobacter youngae ATCC 29220]|uniref:Uncharacterized protein n=1 Tax=Citrobacter youngae ATCC 29220 TaxID=500640 RepID=D4BF17_9ENTR|nr:hypothetical protein CIT292_09383 [Citrobacter youngae ATCC 29220]